jgi:hypothetical protein
MSELIVPVDVEAATITQLLGDLAAIGAHGDVDVQTGIRNPRPARHVRVLAVGGVDGDLVSTTPRVVLEAFAETEEAAAALANLCFGFMKRAGRDGRLGGVPCSRLDVESLPQNLPDPTTDAIRYTATYLPRLRSTVVA